MDKLELCQAAQGLESAILPFWPERATVSEWRTAFSKRAFLTSFTRQELCDYIDFLVAVIFGPEPEPKPPSTAFTAGWTYYPGEK